MSGHNKWSQIKRQKGAEDTKRSRRFSILARVITIEAKRANGDRRAVGLKTAIDKARAENVPNENIERAIKNALGDESAILEAVRYEAYGPGGAALIIEGITDNKNRTAQEIKHLLTESGGSLTAVGGASWAFTQTAPGFWQAKTERAIPAEDQIKLQSLIEALRGHDDVATVSTDIKL